MGFDARAVLALAFLALCAPARAGDEGALFYADFQHFCVATNADPDAVRKAAVADRINPVTAQAWRHTIGGRTLTISAGVQLIPATPDRPAMTIRNCAVISDANEDDGLAAIRNWAAVPNGFPEGLRVSFFDFRVADGRHIAVSPRGAASTFHGHWTVMLRRDANAASVHYAHVMPGAD